MGRPSRATQEKRNRERAQKEKQQEKAGLRAARKEARAARSENDHPGGVDPDLLGIFPGPQPRSDD
jgi:hypothetical protein